MTLFFRYERHILFPKLLSSSDDYSSDNMMFNSDSHKYGTARRYMCSVLSDSVNCYTFEVSVYGYKTRGSNIIIPYTEESCILKKLLIFFLYNLILSLTLYRYEMWQKFASNNIRILSEHRGHCCRNTNTDIQENSKKSLSKTKKEKISIQ